VAFVGFGLIGGAGYQALESRRFVEEGIAVPGKVSSFEEYTKKDGKVVRRYLGTLTLPDGSEASLQLHGGRNVGDLIQGLALKESDGFEVKENSHDGLWREPIAMGLGGVFWISIIGFFFWLALRRNREIKRLIKEGVLTEVTIDFVGNLYNLSTKGKNGKRRYGVSAKSADGRGFISEYHRRQPRPSLVGERVRILVDKDNPRSYYFPFPG